MNNNRYTIAHSPDADDAFMFYASTKNLIDMQGYSFEHILCDIQTLSKLAIEEQTYDVSAISYFAYPQVSEHYDIMPVGSSMGDNYGPILITKSSNLSEINTPQLINNIKAGHIPVAIPGLQTSSYLALKLWAPDIQVVAHNFDEIQTLVSQGKYQAGLIIHEGQIIYNKQSSEFTILEDLGKWWHNHTNGLILPLGCNIIRKSIANEDKKNISQIIKSSIEYSMNNKSAAIEFALQYGRGLDQNDASDFIDMYVNDLTLDLGERGKKSIDEFYRQAFNQKLITHIPELNF